MVGSEGRLYRTGDLSTDNLTAIGSAANEWTHEDEDSWDPNDPNEESRVSVVKFSDDKEMEDGREVSPFIIVITFYLFILFNHSLTRGGCGAANP